MASPPPPTSSPSIPNPILYLTATSLIPGISPSKILPILLDFSKYKEWNTFTPVIKPQVDASWAEIEIEGDDPVKAEEAANPFQDQEEGIEGRIKQTKKTLTLPIYPIGTPIHITVHHLMPYPLPSQREKISIWDIPTQTQTHIRIGGSDGASTGEIKDGCKIAWESDLLPKSMGWMLKTERVQVVNSDGKGGSVYTTSLAMQGIQAHLVKTLFGSKLQKCLERCGSDLKREVERREGRGRG